MITYRRPRRLFFILLVALALANPLLGCTRTPEQEYLAGVEAIARGDWEAAERHLERAGETGDAPERLGTISGKLNSLRRDYDTAYAAMRDQRWFDAFESLNRVAALEPGFRDTQKRLAKVRRKLDEALTKAEKLVQEGELERAAALLATAGEFKAANTRQAAVAALASQCAGHYQEMRVAADDESWVEALESGALLLSKSPNYRDAASHHERNLRNAYAAAETLLAGESYGEASLVLLAIEAAHPHYERAHTLLPTASAHAVADLMGVHPYRLRVGENRGWDMWLTEIEVRPEGEIIARVEIENATSLRNRIGCPQNAEDETAYHLISATGEQMPPNDCSCLHGKIDEYLLGPGESFQAWWQYPPQENAMTPFGLAFGAWGTLSDLQLKLP